MRGLIKNKVLRRHCAGKQTNLQEQIHVQRQEEKMGLSYLATFIHSSKKGDSNLKVGQLCYNKNTIFVTVKHHSKQHQVQF